MEAENTCHSLYQLRQTRGLESPQRLLSSQFSWCDDNVNVMGFHFHLCFKGLYLLGKHYLCDPLGFLVGALWPVARRFGDTGDARIAAQTKNGFQLPPKRGFRGWEANSRWVAPAYPRVHEQNMNTTGFGHLRVSLLHMCLLQIAILFNFIIHFHTYNIPFVQFVGKTKTCFSWWLSKTVQIIHCYWPFRLVCDDMWLIINLFRGLTKD